MVARAKVVTAKWGVPSTEPDDLPDFLSNEEIAEKMGGDPRGVFRVWIKKITVVKNKNDDDMLKITAEIFDTAKDKKGYNGYAFWENQNITEQGAPFLKQFLKSIGVSWADFQQRTKMTAETKTEPRTIISIGKVNLAGKAKVTAKVTTRGDNYQGNDRAVVGRWLPKDSDTDVEEEIEDDDELLEDEDLEDEDLEEVEEDEDLEDEEDEDEELEEDPEEELRAELADLSLPDLRKRVKTNDASAKTTGLKKDALIDLIVEQESLLDEDEEDEELEEDEEDGAEDELREELAGMTIGALKKRAKDNGAKVAVLNKMKVKDKVIDLIVEQELSGDEDGDEEPPF